MKPFKKILMASASLLVIGASAKANTLAAPHDEHLVLADTIDVQSPKGIGAFDISFVDPKTNLYILADRTNGSVDLFNARDATFIGRIGGFTGAVLKADGTANNPASGPDGVVLVGGTTIWAGDGDSTLKVLDITSMKVVDTISTGGKLRVDEMAFDSADHILAAANNADVPPFVTMVNTDSHRVVGKIVFDGKDGTPDATETGVEQPQWSPQSGQFYVSVPQIDPKDDTKGGVAVIDPVTNKVTAVYPVSKCSPAGLALGPNNEALVGCGGTFGTKPNQTTETVIISLKDGSEVARLPIGGSDEVWYDSATSHYYLAAYHNADGSGKITPVIGTVDAISHVLDSTTPSGVTSHSIAADKASHHIFVPVGFVSPTAAPGTDPTNACPDPKKGCIAVYLPSSVDSDDLAPTN